MSNLKKYRTSLTIIAIVLILMLLAMYQSAFADEPFQPVMPTTEIEIIPSGLTTGSTPVVRVRAISGPFDEMKKSFDQVQIVVSSATVTYFDGWFVPGLHNTDTYHVPVNIPIGTDYVISVRGWNNNGFGEWVVSGLNTVVPKGTDCYSNPYVQIDYVTYHNPSCQ